MTKKTGKIVKILLDETIIRKIYVIRGHKVMLDSDLAELYEVETKYLKRQVKRSIDRFPSDFMFELNVKEYNSLRSQIGTLKRGQHTKYMPYAFTEQGVAMLSGIVNSEKAVKMNIAIMRAFVELRKISISNKKLAEQINEILERVDGHDVHLNKIYDAIENLLDKEVEKKSWGDRKRIGFK